MSAPVNICVTTPSTAATNAFIPGIIPINGSIFPNVIPTSTPAAAANAEPIAKVNDIVR